ncbi:aminoglycoside nucleotidyltransferase [Actinoplanes sp. TRM 88003]|uniref:Aminoglycoside nucleotidyltransferase n=1 Tax=Paractinoplanes aksuensis TaxID=2939490 RepID=A0ABT1DI04_9ACTN|nr:aminoglycoside nucleotidyltransferase [Actinoplanes aksuensis]MCO8270133.1 aminoglycoside nucleotidyltransferase [Actinoplanes aksuensis]
MTYLMTAGDVIDLVRAGEKRGVELCVGGGWGVDALLGEQTREHADLDVWLPAGQFEKAVLALRDTGVDRLYPWPGDRPWNFVVHDGGRLRIDLHVYEMRADGAIHYGSAVGGESFPAAALGGSGVVGGVSVRCEAAEWSVRWHTGYPPREQDQHDVPLLCERFGISLPDGYQTSPLR